MDLFAGEVDAPPGRRNQRRIEAQPPSGANRFGLLHGVLNAGQDQVASRAPLAGGSFVEAAVKFRR